MDFLFPISVMKIEDKNYIVDGEATYKALCELEDRGFNLPEIPIVYIESDDVKKVILIGTSTDHCVTEISLKEFVKGTNIDLKSFSFSDFKLIDFHSDVDLGFYIEIKGGKFSEQKLNKFDFEGLLK